LKNIFISLQINIALVEYDSFIFHFEDEEKIEKVAEWINENWEKVSNPWNKLQKLGTFSNGEGIYQNV
jgi:hypothetical protein